jgi:hypothetical protein
MENPNIEEIKKAYHRYLYQKYRKPKYNESEEFRKKNIKQHNEWSKNKRETDPVYAEKIRENCRERYRNDEAYRESFKLSRKERYRNDEAYRERTKLINKERYHRMKEAAKLGSV